MQILALLTECDYFTDYFLASVIDFIIIISRLLNVDLYRGAALSSVFRSRRPVLSSDRLLTTVYLPKLINLRMQKLQPLDLRFL